MSYDIVQETVPPFTRRIGDYAFQGSNNTLIVCGTDRAKNGPATIDDGLGHLDAQGKGIGTGTIYAIAGRTDKNGDPDLLKDKSILYITMKSDMDAALGLTGVESDGGKVPYAVVKSDCLRFVYRQDVKICIEDGSNYVYMDKGKIHIDFKGGSFIEMVDKKITIDANKGGTQIVIDGSKVKIVAASEIDIGGSASAAIHKSFMTEFDNHIHPTSVGPTQKPVVPQSSVPTNFTDGYSPKVKFPG